MGHLFSDLDIYPKVDEVVSLSFHFSVWPSCLTKPQSVVHVVIFPFLNRIFPGKLPSLMADCHEEGNLLGQIWTSKYEETACELVPNVSAHSKLLFVSSSVFFSCLPLFLPTILLFFFSPVLVSFRALFFPFRIPLPVCLCVCLAVGGVVQRKLLWEIVEGRGCSNGFCVASLKETFCHSKRGNFSSTFNSLIPTSQQKNQHLWVHQALLFLAESTRIGRFRCQTQSYLELHLFGQLCPAEAWIALY